MEALSSSFLAEHPQLLHVSSFRIKVKRPAQPHIITVNSSFTTFQPIKKLIKHTAPTLETLKNPPPSRQVERNKKSLLAIIFNTLDDFICSFIDLPLRPSIDPKHVLSGNFAPLDELPPTACDVVEGSLPSCLDGAYIRNGPNPQFIPKGPYHFLDGDGMLHMIKISQGKAMFCSRYVKTHKHMVEREIGYPFVPSVFSSFNGFASSIARCVLTVARVLTGQIDPVTQGFGTANTSVALFGGHLFALCESDLPYAVKVTAEGDIITLGRHDFQSSEPFLRMTAHPKIDQETGEAFAYGYNITRPFLTFFRISSDGRKQKDVPIFYMEGCTVVHDFALTKNYAIFPDIQIVVNPLWILRGRSPVGTDPAKVPRLGIIPRYAEDESGMWWIDVPGLNMLHCVNAWEEDGGDTIVIVASNIVSVEQILENTELSQLTLEKITIDVKAKSMQRHPLSTQVLDFAVINPAYAAKKNRYLYAGVIGLKSWLGVVKLDLSLTNADGGDCTVASRLYGSGWCGGEPFFVPRESNNPAAEEDDGYLVTYVYDENTKESKFLVMDAKSPTLDIIAAVKLPRRVPIGFHGLFVSQTDLNKLCMKCF
ncbi:hypothetical protein Pfo_010565 [Paulownia fortunei]|nr:hypothetical protein Pfo_010565 [Paulownia fortunei]